jgi:hypothetical protein
LRTAALLVATRLGAQNIKGLVRDRHSGTMQRDLADVYGISLSNMKRILRRHRFGAM